MKRAQDGPGGGGGARNVLGGPLADCSHAPLTGWFRDGCCNTEPRDFGVHTVCVRVSGEFLAFSRAKGNDLTTAAPDHGFPGLQPGDQWCLCASRWREALLAGCAPAVVLAATHERTLDVVELADLKRHALDLQ